MNKIPRISIISAIGKYNRVIGKEDGSIPWRISEDFKYFKKITMGHPIIMGRKTFESLPGILPGRIHIVVTRNGDYEVPDGVIVVTSLENAIDKASDLGKEEIFIIGGGQIYKESIELADRLYLTLVDTDVDGSVFFPEYKNIFTKTISSKKSSDDNLSFEFLVLEK